MSVPETIYFCYQNSSGEWHWRAERGPHKIVKESEAAFKTIIECRADAIAKRNENSEWIINVERATNRSEEEIIREELRAYREVIIKLLQWGVTLLASLQAAFFFLRKEYLGYLMERKIIAPGPLPFRMYIGGTGLLFAVALIFTMITTVTGKNYRVYQTELAKYRSTLIEDPMISKRRRGILRVVVYGLFFFFPLIDLVLRFLYVGFR